ncbi:MAG: glycosyltransferase family 2 protein [Oscillospiraceae bacterium]|nr:glycosyltransferase family 2 protein [Oscillospiraceae bacterium]
MTKVSFVIPCYRSEKTISAVVEEIRTAMATLEPYEYEIVLVNDSSPDGTFGVIRALAEQDARITAVDLAKNFGQHAALMCGMRHSDGDVIVCLDDDGQTPADEVGKLLEQIEAGYDVVYASYEDKRESGFRRFGSAVNARMTEIMLGKPRELSLTSYFAARRFIVDEMLRYDNCFPYVMGLVLRSTKRVCNVPVTHRDREQGASGYTLGKLLGLWMNGFTSFSIKPLRMATYLGAFTALAGFVYALVAFIRFFAVHKAPLGWTSTTILLLILGGMILLVLGLVGEYVGRVFMCVNASPQYVEREVVGEKENA